MRNESKRKQEVCLVLPLTFFVRLTLWGRPQILQEGTMKKVLGVEGLRNVKGDGWSWGGKWKGSASGARDQGTKAKSNTVFNNETRVVLRGDRWSKGCWVGTWAKNVG